MDPANPCCPLHSPSTFFGECPKPLFRPSQRGPPMYFTAEPCLTPGPCFCAGKPMGLRTMRTRQGPWEASVQAVSRTALIHASAPCLPSTTGPSCMCMRHLQVGDSQTREDQMSLWRGQQVEWWGSLVKKHNAEAGRQLHTPNPARLHAGGRI